MKKVKFCILTIQLTVGNVDVAATTATGWSAIALDDVGDKAVLFYVDDTIGWIIWSLIGVAAHLRYIQMHNNN